MNKPIFGKKWYKSKKPPSLQIKILNSIMLGGELSKLKASKILDSKYPDVSDAMDALAANDRQFIKMSRETGRGRPEKFYKITENGLRALLVVSMTPKVSIVITSLIFWRVILLLSVCSKQPISKEELDNYYRQFEESTLGHSPIHGYFFQSYFFDSMLDNWLQNLSNISGRQKIIECLAINRSITLNELIEKTRLKKEEIIEILKNHTLQADQP